MTQLEWTRRLLNVSPHVNDDRTAAAHYRINWWYNPTNKNSMRLTREGFQFASFTVKIQHYSHTLGEEILPKTLLQLEKSLQYPYYIKTLKELIVFDEATSFTLILYNNNLQQYLDNIQKFNSIK